MFYDVPWCLLHWYIYYIYVFPYFKRFRFYSSSKTNNNNNNNCKHLSHESNLVVLLNLVLKWFHTLSYCNSLGMCECMWVRLCMDLCTCAMQMYFEWPCKCHCLHIAFDTKFMWSINKWFSLVLFSCLCSTMINYL